MNIDMFITKSGSKYIIDYENKTWKRERGEEAAETRTDEGTFDEIYFAGPPTYNKVGQTIILVCPPLVAGFTREITSTPIIVSYHAIFDLQL